MTQRLVFTGALQFWLAQCGLVSVLSKGVQRVQKSVLYTFVLFWLSGRLTILTSATTTKFSQTKYVWMLKIEDRMINVVQAFFLATDSGIRLSQKFYFASNKIYFFCVSQTVYTNPTCTISLGGNVPLVFAIMSPFSTNIYLPR